MLVSYCNYSGCEIIIVHRKPLWFICTFDIVANRREEMEWVATWCWLLKELFQLCVLIKWTAVLWLESKKSSGKDFVTCMTKISCQSGRSLSRKQGMETYWMSFCSVGTVSRKQAMRVCDECCSKITGANATQFFLFHFQGLWSRHTQDRAEESWTQRFCAMYYSYSWEESGIYRFFLTVVVISLLGTVWYDLRIGYKLLAWKRG